MISKRAASALRNPEQPSGLRALVVYAAQNPGLEYGNYASGWNDKNGRAAYFSESRRISKQWREVKHYAGTCEILNVTDDELVQACSRAYSGRLTLARTDLKQYRVDYCAGQYWPTEYRQAVACVLELAAEYAFRRNGAKKIA